MAERVLQYTATIPAGTAQSSPTTVPLDLDNFEIEAIDLEVPAGPAGAMGFYLANNGQPWIPRVPGQWIVWDGDRDRFYATNYPTAGGWEIVGYNAGANDHDVIARFHVNQLASPAAAAPAVALTFVTRDVPARAPVIL